MPDDMEHEVGRPKMSGMAVTSLLLGILSLLVFLVGPVFALPAVIFGHVASARVRRSDGAQRGHALAVVGFLLGYFCLTFWGYTLYHLRYQRFDHIQTAYQKDFQSENAEVGTALNIPLGRAVPDGRYASVVAFPPGRTNEQVVLYAGPRGEAPVRPVFVSAASNVVTYRLPDNTTTSLTIRLREGGLSPEQVDRAVLEETAKILGTTPDLLKPEEPFSHQPKAGDDLDFVETIMAIEERLGVEISDDAVDRISGAKGTRNIVERLTLAGLQQVAREAYHRKRK
jgi:acyl carrier protein